MMNKKGTIADEVLLFIPKIIFLVVLIFTFVILVKVLIVTNIDTKQIEAELLVNRLLFSQDGFSYYDESIDRLYPAIIDLESFKKLQNNPNILDSEIINYGKDNPIISAKITLKRENEMDIPVFYNKQRYDRWEPRVLPGITGGGREG